MGPATRRRERQRCLERSSRKMSWFGATVRRGSAAEMRKRGGVPGAMRRTTRWILQRFWLGALVAAVLVAVLAKPKAEPAPGDDTLVLAADTALGEAMRS